MKECCIIDNSIMLLLLFLCSHACFCCTCFGRSVIPCGTTNPQPGVISDEKFIRINFVGLHKKRTPHITTSSVISS